MGGDIFNINYNNYKVSDYGSSKFSDNVSDWHDSGERHQYRVSDKADRRDDRISRLTDRVKTLTNALKQSTNQQSSFANSLGSMIALSSQFSLLNNATSSFSTMNDFGSDPFGLSTSSLFGSPFGSGYDLFNPLGSMAYSPNFLSPLLGMQNFGSNNIFNFNFSDKKDKPAEVATAQPAVVEATPAATTPVVPEPAPVVPDQNQAQIADFLNKTGAIGTGKDSTVHFKVGPGDASMKNLTYGVITNINGDVQKTVALQGDQDIHLDKGQFLSFGMLSDGGNNNDYSRDDLNSLKLVDANGNSANILNGLQDSKFVVNNKTTGQQETLKSIYGPNGKPNGPTGTTAFFTTGTANNNKDLQTHFNKSLLSGPNNFAFNVEDTFGPAGTKIKHHVADRDFNDLTFTASIDETA